MTSEESKASPPPPNFKDSGDHIAKVDDDVLLQIFMLNTKLDFYTPHIPSRTTRYTSQVSARWRNLTLDSPMLWSSSLNFAEKMPWIQTILERARDVPLSVTYPPFSEKILLDKTRLSAWRHLELEHRVSLVHAQSDDSDPFADDDDDVDDDDEKRLDMVLSLFSKCRRFRLRLYDNRRWKYARAKSISLNAPHLEELVISVMNMGKSRGSQPTEFTIFDVATSSKPNLKILHLSGYGLTYPPTFKSGELTTLVIERLEARSSLSVNEWLEILSCLPRIEVLHLHNCFKQDDRKPIPEVDETWSGTPVSLSELRSISLIGGYVDVATTLLLLQPPRFCAMNLRFGSQIDNVYAYPALLTKTFSFLQTTIQHFVAQQKIGDLSLFLKYYSTERILGWKFWNNIHSGDEKTFSVAWLSPEAVDTTPLFLSLKQILEVISPDLTSLYLDTANIADNAPAHRLGLLRALENVDTLSIPSLSTLGYIWKLFTDHRAAANKEHPLLPALQLITLGSIYVKKKAKAWFYEIFEIRSQLGISIPNCRVQDCGGPLLEELINDLSGLGASVEWVGKFEDTDSDSVTEHITTRVLEHWEIQAEWNGRFKEDKDDWFDSDDLRQSDSDGESESDSDEESDENSNED